MKLTEAQEKVREFTRLAGQEIPDHPTTSNYMARNLRSALIHEELGEYMIARDLVEIADAIGDILYVVLGAASHTVSTSSRYSRRSTGAT
jgi:predicted HAD superfamily Cof-like phosphohydrolase